MQTLSCVVRLNGELGFTVFKDKVTPAEIVVLRSIHGADAVVDIKHAGGMDKRPHKIEKDRSDTGSRGATPGYRSSIVWAP